MFVFFLYTVHFDVQFVFLVVDAVVRVLADWGRELCGPRSKSWAMGDVVVLWKGLAFVMCS